MLEGLLARGRERGLRLNSIQNVDDQMGVAVDVRVLLSGAVLAPALVTSGCAALQSLPPEQKAEQLVTAAALAAALSDSWVEARIGQDVAAYHQSGAERVPVLISPGFDTIVGRPESAEALFEILETELELQQR